MTLHPLVSRVEDHNIRKIRERGKKKRSGEVESCWGNKISLVVKKNSSSKAIDYHYIIYGYKQSLIVLG